MKKYTSSSVFVALTFLALQVTHVFASACTLNGEVIPCDQMPVWPFYIMIGFFVLMMILSIFWVWMIVDVLKHEDEKEKMLWILVVLLAQIFGAVIYYFVRKRHRDKRRITSSQEGVDEHKDN